MSLRKKDYLQLFFSYLKRDMTQYAAKLEFLEIINNDLKLKTSISLIKIDEAEMTELVEELKYLTEQELQNIVKEFEQNLIFKFSENAELNEEEQERLFYQFRDLLTICLTTRAGASN